MDKEISLKIKFSKYSNSNLEDKFLWEVEEFLEAEAQVEAEVMSILEMTE